jgi:NAD(P)-dependent dehydrogenase (short-subunit alcohol dehydrogenase family)
VILDRFSLAGKVALVVGASRGIGRAIAEGLAEAGADLAVASRSTADLEEAAGRARALGRNALALTVDARDLEQLRGAVDRTVEGLGRLDILVYVAGMNRRMPVLEMSPEVYQEIMDVNLRGAYFASQAAAAVMVRQGGGKIIHIASLTSTFGLKHVSVYGASKGGVAQLTKALAVEWAEHNILVNAIAPGFIETALTGPVFADPRRRQWILDRTPLKRPGRPDDLVGTAVWLASPASDFVTGQVVYVDGGFTAGSQW